ncbi:MAG: hypothetical protein GY765_08255 [bacterium]|nr:hypothetical protein [bacterium]
MSKEYVTLKVAHSGREDRLKITWRDVYGYPFDYEVHRTQLLETGKECRELLNRLTEEFKNPLPRYGPILQTLAKKGNDLYYLLFDGCASNRDTAAEAKELLKNSVQKGTKLTVAMNTSVHIPWGLVYAGEPPADDPTTAAEKAKGKIEHFPGFWALAFSLSVFYSVGPVKMKLPLPRQSFKLLSALNKDEYLNVREMLGKEELAFFDTFMEREVGRTFSSRGCKQLWREVGDNECLIHFYCHSNGTELILAEDDKIGVVGFKRLFSRGDSDSNNLVFLNGCTTAVGELDMGFLSATAEPGFCGFVGAEARLPNTFALRFGLALLYCLLEEGLCLQEAVDMLRRRHWPLGLLYGCYAHPDFQIEPSAARGPEAPGFLTSDNFSKSGEKCAV